MNRVTARTSGTRHSIGTPRASHKHVLFIAGALLAALVPAIAQMSASGDLQEKIAAVKQSIAENKQKLQHYQWVETPTTYEWYHPPPTQWVVLGNITMSGG